MRIAKSTCPISAAAIFAVAPVGDDAGVPRECGGVVPTLMPGAAFPDAEEFLDGLAVQMACVHAAEHIEDFGSP